MQPIARQVVAGESPVLRALDGGQRAVVGVADLAQEGLPPAVGLGGVGHRRERLTVGHLGQRLGLLAVALALAERLEHQFALDELLREGFARVDVFACGFVAAHEREPKGQKRENTDVCASHGDEGCRWM